MRRIAEVESRDIFDIVNDTVRYGHYIEYVEKDGKRHIDVQASLLSLASLLTEKAHDLSE